jgi:hypothetical protein
MSVRSWNEYFPVVGSSEGRIAELCPNCVREFDQDPVAARASLSFRRQLRFWLLALGIIVALAALILILYLGGLPA